ncbi:MAG: hypothetical protein IPP45_14745 [Sphingomonadales bacterium]|nr:hypothetical protein [Sphingomonadales bacterium]
MKFARANLLAGSDLRHPCLAAGIFPEDQFSRTSPPALTHPEFYYGFYGSALVWQFAFILIARDPVRYRPLMLVSVLEKAGFFFACLWLWSSGRLGMTGPFYGSLIDGLLMILFAIAWVRTPSDDRA